MGLDSVELVMKVEEEFGIEIPNDIASKLYSVGELHAFVVAELARLGRPEPDDRTYEKLRDIICRQLGVRAEDVTPEARFVDDLRID